MSAEFQRVIHEIDAYDSDAEQQTARSPRVVGPARIAIRIRLLSAVVLVVALIALSRWSTTRHVDAVPTSNASAAVPVVMETVRRVDLTEYLTGIGNVQANTSATVRVRVDGQLQRIHFIEGQDVAAGQLLAQIDAAPLRAQLQVAQAQLAREQATLNNARADLKRYSDLVQSGLVSKQTVETQSALVAQSEAVVAAAQAQVEYARVQLSYTDIKAPISGRIGTRLIDVGNMVRASEATGLVVINQIDPVTVSFTLPEDRFSRVNAAIRGAAANQLAVLALDDGDQVIATGKLLVLNNQIDTASGTIQLKAVFDNQQHELWPGQFVHARLILGETRAALTIPAAAVQRGPEGTFVYLHRHDGTVAAAPVTVTRYQEQLAVIASGLKEHDEVVIAGQSKLRPGAKVVQQGLPVERTS